MCDNITMVLGSKPSRQIVEQAKLNPGGWVYELDWRYREDQFIPPESIRGSWKVDGEGNVTDVYVVNEDYRPIRKASRKPLEYLTNLAELQLSEGRTERDEWMVEIDPIYNHLFPNIPIEGIVGRWYVGEDGRYTNLFRPNPKYSGNILT